MKMQNKIKFKGKEYLISTVKLLDEIKLIDFIMGNHDKDYETMIFQKNNHDWDFGNPIYTKPHNTREEAIQCHEYCLKHLEEFIK